MRYRSHPLPRPTGVVALLLLALAAGSLSAQTATPADSGVVRVSGTGQVSVAPDHGRVSFAVETRGDDAAETSRENAERMTAVLEAVRGTEVEGLEVETFGYALRPIYRTVTEDGERVQRLDGYQATNNVSARFSDIEAAGRIIDAAVEAGANRIAGLSFYAEETAEARDEALGMAVENATREARVMAAALGRTLGGALEIQGGAQQPRPAMRFESMDMAMAQARSETPVEAGDQTVSAQVSITFRLGPPR